jgi:hypothetical protein
MRVSRTVLVGLLLGSSSLADAQECGESPKPEIAFRKAALVFRGVVRRIEDPSAIEPIDPATGKLNIQPVSGFKIVTFQVSEVWKGRMTAMVQLFVFERPPTGGGFIFQQGGDYVVYALDVVNQRAPMVEKYSTRSKVYGLGLGCVMRVRRDVNVEAKQLDRIASKGAVSGK